MRPLKDLFMHELLSTGSPEPPVPSENVITGSFKGTTAGEVLEVTLDIPDGSYPKHIFIYPKNDYYSLTSVLANGGIVTWEMCKWLPDSPPPYDTSVVNGDRCLCTSCYKSNSIVASAVASDSANDNVFKEENPWGGGIQNSVRLSTPKKMLLFILSNRKGFIPDIDYNYIVLY